MSTQASGTRYRSLDHWRGFAALWVMVFHAFNVWLEAHPALLPPPLSWLCLHGWLGAHVFFVISGYCIAERCAREYRTGGTVRVFFEDRLLRIYPPYWAALLFLVGLNLAGALVAGAAFVPGNPLPAGGVGWLQAFMAVEHWAGRPGYLLVAWTISFEIGFYALAALGLALALRTQRPWTGWALGLGLLVVGLTPAASLLPLLTLWPHFALGGIVWLLLRLIPVAGARLALGAGIFALVALVAWIFPSGRSPTLLFVLTCALLLLALQPLDARIAAAPWLRWLGWTGTFSYSLYLIHAPVVGKFRNLLARWCPPDDPRSLWVPAAACGLAVLASWLFYKLIEQRVEKWRRKYLARPVPNLS